jgi:tryptophan 2,3-dioxygenase
MEYPKDPYISIHYKKYLGLEQLLSAQRLRSEDLEKPAHDEMLFIIIHQVYELWFKQIIHELESVNKMFKNDYLDERSIGTAVERLDRVIVIFELLVQQIKVLETMTPMDFLDFRSYLFPASGFQSFQFRKMEVMLGLPADQRITYNNKPYHSAFSEEERTELEMLENNGSLVKELIDWLERIPFLQFNEFSFLASYKEAVQHMIAKEQQAIRDSQFLSDKEKEMRLIMLGDTNNYFESIFDENAHNQLVEEGTLRFSYKATIAALFIKLYKDEPILQLPNLLLERLIDVEELLTVWRYRHAQMVLRMLGKKIGTGGSSGHTYLAKTAEKHHIFHDLYNLSTMMIPRGDLPELPEELRESLGFVFTKK